MVSLVALVSVVSAYANVQPSTADLIATPAVSNIKFVQKNELGNYFKISVPANAPAQGKFTIYNQNGEIVYSTQYTNASFQKTVLLTADVDLSDALTLQFEQGKKAVIQTLDAGKLLPKTQVVIGNIWEEQD